MGNHSVILPRNHSIIGVFLVLVIGISNNLHSQSGSAESQLKTNQVDELITELVKHHIPESYTDDKKWGTQARRYHGFKFRREGWKIETKRKWKMVNHGTWRKYSLGLVDPSKGFGIEMLNVRKLPDDHIAFTVKFNGDIWINGRQTEWVKGVQLYSVNAEGNASVTLETDCKLKIRADWSTLPPNLHFEPQVVAARINVENLKIHRVSKIGGELAQQVTRATKKWLKERNEKHQQKLVTKLNEQIKKKKDRLKLNVSKLVRNRFVDSALPHLAKPLKKVVDENIKKSKEERGVNEDQRLRK